ncbi:MAG: hypothetical protein EXS32_07920 [Opitutus sp.]|nr:hypothetical protein [Opitutus sp.]
MPNLPAQRRQFLGITVGALAVFAVMRFLPTGTNLNHMDFRVTARNAIDFCDPLNPQFIPVVTVASPVTMTITSIATPPAPGVEARFTVTLKTASGKPIAPEDLLIAHTRKLHLLIVDPWMDDYQHVHPAPGRRRGEWTFGFTPRREGRYRVFADFTPVATGRGLYAFADVPVGRAGLPEGFTMVMQHDDTWSTERDGFRFALTPAAPMRASRPADLKFAISRAGGGGVPLEPVMGAFAHLVAFDEARSGFAHLHPMEEDLTVRPDAAHPTLNFKITIPRAGRYVIWAQVKLAGREVFVPFWFEVAE